MRDRGGQGARGQEGLALVLVLAACAPQGEPPVSAFRFKTDPAKVKARIALEEVLQGVASAGPDPRDVIPSILEPNAVAAEAATWVGASDRVLGLAVNGEARAYPLRILQVHEFVNDFLGGVAVGATY
jgi:hypothetical protein